MLNGSLSYANMDKEVEDEKNFLFNIYTFVLIIIFISNCILNYFFLKDYTYVIVFLILIFIMFLTLFLPNSIRFNKILVFLTFYILGLLTFYCDIIAGKDAMNYLSYISLTTAMSFFFNYRKDKIAIITLIVSFIIFFLINYYTNYSLLPNLHQNLSFTEQHYIRFYKTLEVVFCTLVAVYFIHRKEKIIIRYIVETEGLNKRLKENKQILSRDLYDMAVNNNPLFISSFSSSFPNFFNSILKINPQIIAPELEICALIKLGLRTKEIAQVTKSTVRSVENKKYRIRKKLNIPSDVDTNLFIINTFNIDD